MKRTDASGHSSNQYTEGNPSLGIPATVLGAEEMNQIQEELAKLVESAGLVVDQTGASETQVTEAIKIIVEDGGTNNGQLSILDGQSASDVTPLAALDKTKTKSAKMIIDIFRRDDSQSKNELFELAAIYDPEGDAWSLSFTSMGDDAGVSFSITALGQLQYASTTFGGLNYSGTLRVSHVKKLAI